MLDLEMPDLDGQERGPRARASGFYDVVDGLRRQLAEDAVLTQVGDGLGRVHVDLREHGRRDHGNRVHGRSQVA